MPLWCCSLRAASAISAGGGVPLQDVSARYGAFFRRYASPHRESAYSRRRGLEVVSIFPGSASGLLLPLRIDALFSALGDGLHDRGRRDARRADRTTFSAAHIRQICWRLLRYRRWAGAVRRIRSNARFIRRRDIAWSTCAYLLVLCSRLDLARAERLARNGPPRQRRTFARIGARRGAAPFAEPGSSDGRSCIRAAKDGAKQPSQPPGPSAQRSDNEPG